MTLTATDQSPCTGSKSESITLNITPLGNISLSPVNAVVCSSEVIELDISVLIMTQLLWLLHLFRQL
ncbi:MAG: hypothetical protein CM15mP83_3400 [Flavobacteriaceae bacterium]|nr:MAG: hypothetical protein CM15mP83_3400 [Flavobacteriaceae bacterium]